MALVADAGNAAPLSERLAGVCVGLRADLSVTRHVFRGEPTYVIGDPLTFQSHKLSLRDYRTLISLRADRTLSDIFDALVEQEHFREEDRERFFEFVVDLHRLGFLNLPVSDDKLLYRRFMARRRMRRKQRIVGFLFLQLPLWNPDRFLQARKRFADLAFSRFAFFVWLIAICAGAGVLFTRWDAFRAPLSGVLAIHNLPLLWITLVGLKILHEFGHAFACRHYDLHVPEMGVILIAGTPCAYVDATASWGLSSRFQRIVIGLGGMYFESFIAAGAILVWALTRPGLVNDLAHNAVLLAGVVTVLFNINPLMRYDGYYIFSDLVEIPNLRTRSAQYTRSVIRRLTLGMKAAVAPIGRAQRALLLGYGISAPIYKATVMLAIVAMIASKLFYVGLALGGYMIAHGLYTAVRRAVSYLWFSEETSPIRFRAVACSALLIGVPPLVAATVPVRRHVETRAVVAAEHRDVLHARAPGFVESVEYESGDARRAGDRLVRLANEEIELQLAEVEAELDVARLRRDGLLVDDPVGARQESRRVESLEEAASHHRRRVASLDVRARSDGRVVEGVRPTQTGRFIDTGEPLATVVSGGWTARVLLSEDDLTAAEPRIGTPVRFRPASSPEVAIDGVVIRVRPVSARTVNFEALTLPAGGPIPISPDTGLAREPYYEVWVRLNGTGTGRDARSTLGTIGTATGRDARSTLGANETAEGRDARSTLRMGETGGGDARSTFPMSESPVRAPGASPVTTARVVRGGLREGMTGRIQFAAGAEPIGLHVYRSFIRFVRSLQQE